MAAGTSRHRAAAAPVLPDAGVLRLQGAAEHNLKHIDVEIPLRRLVCVTGVSGSGKSTLVHDVLYPALLRDKGKPTENPGRHRALLGAGQIDDVIMVDQSRIGRTTRSNPASYVGAFDAIRDLFARLPQARERKYTPGTFSFNAGNGRCPACGGNGFEHVEMQFLSDVYLRCPGLRRPALSRGSARSEVAARRGTAEKHCRCSRSDGLRGAGIFRRRHGSVRAPGAAGRRRSRLPAPRSARAHPVGRRGAAAQTCRSSRRECRAPKDREGRGGAPRLAVPVR